MREPPRPFGGRAFGSAWISLLVAGLALALAVRGAGPLPGDLAVVRLIQQPQLGGLANLVVHADDALRVLAPLAVLVALLRRRWLAAFFISLAVATGWLIPEVIKPLVARPRPSAELVRVLSPSGDYGFPSTTAFFTTVFFGMIAYLLWRAQPRLLVAAIGAMLVLAFGLSRVYAGEHWPTDVVGGWVLGAAWLLALIVAHRSARGLRRKRRPGRR